MQQRKVTLKLKLLRYLIPIGSVETSLLYLQTLHNNKEGMNIVVLYVATVVRGRK